MDEARGLSVENPIAHDRAIHGYGPTRRADPAILSRIARAVGGAPSVVNIGAGTGSYEPPNRRVVAVEPSDVIIAQRRSDAAPVVKGLAEELPFRDDGYAAAMAILTIQDWADPIAGLHEMRRVARRRCVVLTLDPASVGGYWAYRYFPEAARVDRERFPAIDAIVGALGGTSRIEPVTVPHNCRDTFLGAFWRRPSAFLDARTRRSISTLAAVGDDDLLDGLHALSQDLRTSVWETANAWLLDLPEIDLGYRLVVAEYE